MIPIDMFSSTARQTVQKKIIPDLLANGDNIIEAKKNI
jgi:hypothetical protein